MDSVDENMGVGIGSNNFGKDSRKRGFTGIVLVNPKYEPNVGSVMRTAQVFGTEFVCTIGPQRYKRHRTDTCKAELNVPIWNYQDWSQLWNSRPNCCDFIAVELSNESKPIERFYHPPRGVYVFGPEDGSVPPNIFKNCRYKIKLPGSISLNLANAVAITLFDRQKELAKNVQSNDAIPSDFREGSEAARGPYRLVY